MSKSMQKAVVFTEPKLSSSGKSWFVYFSAANIITGERKRLQFRDEINSFSNKKDRIKAANAVIEFWRENIRAGWSPFKDTGPNINFMLLPEALDFALSKMTVAKKTRSTYKSGISFFKQSAERLGLCLTPVKQVTRQHLKLIFDDIQTKRKKWLHGKTYNKNLGAIKKCFNVLKDWEIISESPAAGLKDMQEIETNKFVPFTDEEKKILRDYLYPNHYRFFIYVMVIYHTGIRPEEVLSLTIDDIDINTATITIQPNLERQNSKTKKIRIVPINAHLMPFFREMRLQDYPAKYYVFGSPFNPGEGHRGSTKDGRGCSHPDYFKPSGTKIKRDSVTKFWNKIVIKKLGINKYLYAMKHTGANEKILAGIDLDALRELYGHSSKLMTEKYAKVVKEVYRKQIMEKSPEF